MKEEIIISDNIQQVSDSELEQILNREEGISIISFVAPWSSESMLFLDYLDRLSKQKDDIKAYCINKEQHNTYFKKYHLKTVPTSIVVRDGEITNHLTGCPSFRQLNEVVEGSL